MQFQDYYSKLGVERTASQDEIKKAYRKLSKEFHPDRNSDPGAEDRFKEIGEAYQVLGDEDSRRRYDSLGREFRDGQDFRPPSGWEGVQFDFDGAFGRRGQSGPVSGFSDFFEMLFGQAQGENPFGPGGKPRGRDGDDREAEIEITLEDAYFGGSRQVTLQATSTGPNGGRTTERKQYDVKIPAGITDGKKIRLKGEGAPGLGGGKRGDLLLKVRIAEHPDYLLEGHDLACTLDIAPWEAALGAKVPLDTLDGEVKLTIPAGSPSGRRMRLKNKGLPRGGKGDDRGDLHVELRIVCPPAKSNKLKKIYEQLREESKFDPRGET